MWINSAVPYTCPWNSKKKEKKEWKPPGSWWATWCQISKGLELWRVSLGSLSPRTKDCEIQRGMKKKKKLFTTTQNMKPMPYSSRTRYPQVLSGDRISWDEDGDHTDSILFSLSLYIHYELPLSCNLVMNEIKVSEKRRMKGKLREV